MTISGRQVLALIPARGGSKGIARKNLRLLRGRTLLSYTLLAAKESTVVDRVFLSSDDAEILEHGRSFGVELVVRPAEYASDTASAIDVVQHFLSTQEQCLKEDPYVLYLQPTSPLRTSSHIDEAFQFMQQQSADSFLSVVEMAVSPYKAFEIDAEGRLRSLFDERLSNARRQDLPRTYLPNGAMYAFRISQFRERNGFPSNGSVPYIMSSRCSIDVDVEADLEAIERTLGETYG